MPAAGLIHFPPFCLDPTNEQLRRGTEPLPLRPKPFAILHYLVEHPGQLVTKEELFKAVWPKTYVSAGLLHTYIRDLRTVLEDDPEAPRFIETVVRRGYRFIAPLTTASPVASRQFQVPRSDTQHLTKALELLKMLPDTPERAQQELTLQITLGAPLMALKGFAAPEVGTAYARARQLCQQVGETRQLFPVLRGLCVFYIVRAELQTAHELAAQLLNLAQTAQDSALLVVAHVAFINTLFVIGEFTAARVHEEQAAALYNPQQHRALAFLYGQDPGVICLSYTAWTLWFLGYPDQGLKRIHEALTLAQEVSHPFSVAYALGLAASIYQCRWEVHTAQEWAEATIALSSEHGFAYRLAWGKIVRGWTLVEQDQGEQGITQMRQGLADYRATGASNMVPYFLALLAEAHGIVGQAEKGFTALAEALAIVNRTGERFYEAELYRLKGTLTLQSKTSLGQVSGASQASQNKSTDTSPQHPTPSTQAESEAEACFLKAIEIARKQQAKSLELRAVISLSRLWLRQGKKKKARQMLAEVYGWFTEGFDTKDLQEARALLQELT